jgi:CheY-like chemotaxis protein
VLQIERTRLLGSAHIIRKSSWNKSTPIIIVTGRADRQTIQDAVAVEASFFLQKPVDKAKA